MACIKRFVLVLFLISAVLGGFVPTAHAVPGVDTTPIPKAPTIREKSDEPQKAAAAFGMPEGFVVELFAAEPDVANPVAFSIDEKGNVFVCETFRQNRGISDNRFHNSEWKDADLASQSVEDRLAYHLRLLGDKAREWEREDDRVRMLVDTNRDGKADHASVFAERFNRVIDGTAAGILARRGNVFLTCIPSLYRLRDTNGDGKADTSPEERTILSTGYGVRVAYRGHDLHGLVLGHDGRLYFSLGDRGYRVEHDGRVDTDPGTGAVFRCNQDGTQLEVVAHGLRNPQEMAFDDLGNLFTVDNNSDAGDRARLVHVMPGAEIGWNMAYQYFSDRGPWHREKLWHLPHAEQPAWILPPVAHMTAGPCGFTSYPGTGLTPHFDGRFMVVDFRGGAAGTTVQTFRMRPKGASFEAFDEEATFRNILATDVDIGPDGAVWVADFVEGWHGPGKGRLWRFRPKDQDMQVVEEVRGLLAGDWSTLDADRLIELIGHPDRRVRREAQWELARRGDVAALIGVSEKTDATPLARVHAAWGLEQIGRSGSSGPKDPVIAALVKATGDEAWEVRFAASRSLGEIASLLTKTSAATQRAAVRSALLTALGDDHAHVRTAAAIAAGRLGCRPGDSPAIASKLAEMAEPEIDAAMRHSIVMGLTGAATPEFIGGLVSHESANVRLVACLTMRRLSDARIAAFLTDANERVALEAARAIHDLPIPAALPALAGRAATGPAADAFLRRAISAAERIGSADSARTLVDVVGRPDCPNDLRLQALDALRVWEKPSPKNRVTNVWQPHAMPRDPSLAKAALEPALDRLLAVADSPKATVKFDEAARSALLTTASALGIEQVGPLLVAWCQDQRCSPASRAKALVSLLASHDQTAVTVAEQLIKDKQPLVRTAARRVHVAKLPKSQVIPDLVLAIDSADVAERQAAVTFLGGIDDPAATVAIMSLVAKLEAGKLDPALELEVHEAAAVRLGSGKADALLAARSSGPDPLGQWRDVMSGGNAASGRDVFFNKTEASCVRCHKAERKGGDVGPTLDGIAGKRDRRHLLESIVHPDAKVDEAFRTTIIVTDKGKTVAGIVVSEDDRVLKLKNAEGKIEAIPVASIDERTSGPSSMPADLAGKLTRRELRDLVEWLGSLKK